MRAGGPTDNMTKPKGAFRDYVNTPININASYAVLPELKYDHAAVIRYINQGKRNHQSQHNADNII